MQEKRRQNAIRYGAGKLANVKEILNGVVGIVRFTHSGFVSRFVKPERQKEKHKIVISAAREGKKCSVLFSRL